MARTSSVVFLFYITVTAILLSVQVSTKHLHSSEGCRFNSNNKTELREPIILSNSSGKLEFYIPSSSNGKLIFEDKQMFIISCPNPRNSLTLSNSNVTVGQCTNGKLKVAGKLQTFAELSCNKSIRGDVRRRANAPSLCGVRGNNQGSFIDIGYYVDTIRGRKDFLPLIEVCHNSKNGQTYFSQHVIHGRLMKQTSRNSFRPGFSTQGLNISASIAYKQPYQKSTFNKLLGSAQLAENYINSKSFLSRGHLAADADFLFAPWQFTTYFYLNAAPQWQAVNGGNWHKVESMVRKLAGQLAVDLRIITGTHGVLTLPSANGTEVEMYMLPKQVLPVPKYIWKLVYSPTSRQAIVLVSLNNPFVKDLGAVETVCADICRQYDWWQDNWSKLEKGFIFCCTYEDFYRNVKTVPEMHVNGVLHGPKRHH